MVCDPHSESLAEEARHCEGETETPAIFGGLHRPQKIGNGCRAQQRCPVAAHIVVSDIELRPFTAAERGRPIDEECFDQRSLVHRGATNTARGRRDVGCNGRTSFLMLVLGQCGSHAPCDIKDC